MNRLITVKGTGNVSVKPDLIIITMDLESHRYHYKRTMQLATDSVNALQEAIQSAGFDKSDLKTTNFNVSTHYKSYRDKDDNYKSKFGGYICEQSLKLEFDFDTRVMEKILTAIAKAPVDPQLDTRFSVKDKAAINEELLINATKNAKRKAEILAKASSVTLGSLVSIDYNWGELHLYSPTRYDMGIRCMSTNDESYAPNIEPDNINVSDTVTFVWQIK